MPLIKQYSRISHHTITTSGLTGSTIFTVPSTEDLSSGTWSVNDLALSEIGVAEGLGRVFIRVGNNIKEFNFGTGGTSTTQQFTGNTSATCITDLYVSNLYGCSPITVRDEMIHKEYAFYTPMSAYTTYGSTVPFLTGASGNVLVTKEYVDNIGFGIGEGNVISVRTITTGNLTNTVYNNGTAGVGAILSATTDYSLIPFIEAVINVGDRILVRLQTNQVHNGVYEVLAPGSSTSKFIFQRTTDSDETSELDGQVVIPIFGASAGRRFGQTTSDPIVGTSNIVYQDVGSLFVTQNTSGTQVSGQIPYWGTTARQLSKGNSNLFYDQTTNRLGIGIGTPQETLHVSGKTRTTNFQMTSGATAGYVLTAIDANGNAAWRPVSGGTGSGGTFTGNTLATCITDLYLSNLYGCGAAITVQDPLQSTNSNANGVSSLAFGSTVTTNSDYAVAFGRSTQTFGEFSFASGQGSQTDGDYSHAEGDNTITFGTHSHAEGTGGITYANHTHVEGSSTIAGSFGYTIDSSAGNGVTTTSIYGDITGEFTVGNFVILSNGNDAEIITVSATTYDAFSNETTIFLDFNPTYTNFIYILGVPTPLNADILNGDYSHAEGSGSFSFGLGSHAEGNGTYSIGELSHSEGGSTKAIGLGSHAEGNLTEANARYAHTEGESTIANANYSHAEGFGSQTNAPHSHAEGYSTLTKGESSHAEGINTETNGDYAHAEGGSTFANGVGSHAEGDATISIGDSSHAEGFGTNSIGEYSHTEGFQTSATTISSHSEGYRTKASGDYSHAEGYLSSTTGEGSHAEGNSCVASGNYSHAEGQLSNSSGLYSHAEGVSTNSSGAWSHAEGYVTVSSGAYSHSEGELTEAIGDGSHSQGKSTKAVGLYSFASGSGSTAQGNTSFIHSTGSLVSGARSVVLGGQGITGASNNTVYVPDFVIKKSEVVPTGSTHSIGEAGSITWDSTHFYWKTSTQWLRVSGLTF